MPIWFPSPKGRLCRGVSKLAPGKVEMKVSDSMQTSPATVTADTAVGDVAKTMIEKGTRQIVVVDGHKEVLGIVTSADLIAKHARLHFPKYFSLLGFSFPVEGRRDDREIEQALAATAGDLMSTNLITVAADTDVDDAAQLMLDNEVSCIPVVDGDGVLLGTIDETDIVRILVVEDGV